MSIQEHYDQWSSQYDTDENRTRDLDREITIENLGKYTFSHVLELGCGTGKNTEFFLSKADSVIGLDFSTEMLAKARTKFLDSAAEFRQADITQDWNLPDGSFDLISVNLVLEHIEELAPVFRQAAEKLRPGGIFYVSELHPDRQLAGSKARFETPEGTVVLETFIHLADEYLSAAATAGFSVEATGNWMHEDDDTDIGRLITFIFKKC